MNTSTSLTLNQPVREDILKLRYRFGLIYGIFAGAGFALSNWGMDAYLLSQVHAVHPWLKLMVAVLVCIPVGGLTGWLASRLDRPFYSVLLWLLAGGMFAWLSVANTFQIYPAMLGNLIPEAQPFLKYSTYDILETNGIMVYIWTSIFWSLIGVIQQPLLEQAVFSLSFFSKIAPFLISMALILVGGLFVDNMNNEPLRSPIIALDATVQFAIDTQGQEIDRTLARRMRVAAVRTVGDWLERPRYYFVSRFDDLLGVVDVIVNFGGDWANCTVVYNQVTYCQPVTP